MPPTLAFIPARFASSRFPGKPLIDLKGKPMIQRVWEQVRKAKGLDSVTVVTDDARIATVVRSFGGAVLMTPPTCPSGTDRIAMALRRLGRVPDDAIVVNIQGDEPLLPPAMIEQVVDLLKRSHVPMATLARPMGPSAYFDPNAVKVLWDVQGLALYFSRTGIPFHRDHPGRAPQGLGATGKAGIGTRGPGQTLRLGVHIGLYAYRCGFLKRLAKAKPCALEMTEKLEQLRVLDMGERIIVGFTKLQSVSVDTPQDAGRNRRLLG